MVNAAIVGDLSEGLWDKLEGRRARKH